MLITRVWKVDGSCNQMDIAVAARNLESRATDATVRAAGADALRIRLTAGEVIETPQAVFLRADCLDEEAGTLSLLRQEYARTRAARAEGALP